MPTKSLNKTICFFLILFRISFLFPQADTLNKINDRGRYEGWWKILYDEKFQETTDTLHSKYCSLEYFINGVKFRGVLGKVISVLNFNYHPYKIKYTPNDSIKNDNVLNGKVLYYDKNNSISFSEIFVNGIISRFNCYTYSKIDNENIVIYEDITDWTILYNNNPYSYYHEIIDNATLSGRTKIKMEYEVFSKIGKIQRIKTKIKPVPICQLPLE